MIGAAICCFALIFLPQTTSFLIASIVIILVLGFLANGAYGIASSVLTETHVPPHIFGAATGMLSVIGFLPESFMHQLFGSYIDQYANGGYTIIFSILAASGVIAVVCCVATQLYLKKAKFKKEDIKPEFS